MEPAPSLCCRFVFCAAPALFFDSTCHSIMRAYGIGQIGFFRRFNDSVSFEETYALDEHTYMQRVICDGLLSWWKGL